MANENIPVTKGWLLDFYNSKIKPYLNGASGAIDDSSTASNKTWSASKIQTQIDAYKHTYSTTERAVGTWIDGKTIYEKTIAITIPTCTTDGTVAKNNYAIGSSVSRFISCDCVFGLNGAQRLGCYGISNKVASVSGTYTYLFCQVFGRDNTAASDVKNTIEIQNYYTSYSGYTGYVTVQYTKV